MKKYLFVISLLTLIALNTNSFAQGDSSKPKTVATNNGENISTKSSNSNQEEEVSRERRKKAYAKLLEGQRYLWSMRRLRSGFEQTSARLAKAALQEAVELNPKLAEAYTALAELAITAPPQNINEAIMLAEIATRLDKDNFGGHRILARLYTIKSNLGRGRLQAVAAKNAIEKWKEVARLDPRNAEAWAFLSEFYVDTNKPDLRIEALKKWLSSAAPIDEGFFNRVMSRRSRLQNQVAILKLGEALVRKGDYNEALSVLNRALADNPRNLKTIELFRQALEGSDKDSLLPAVQALRQAVFANSQSSILVKLLAKTLARTGQIDDAVKVLRGAVEEKAVKNKDSASSLQVVLGDIYADSQRTNEAIVAYQYALKIRGIGDAALTNNDDKDFAIRVVGKMIQIYRKANRPSDAQSLIEKYRILFGKDDLFADKELISLLRETGKKTEALALLKKVKKKFPKDFNLIRTKASLLTDLGRVDEGVAIIRELIVNKPENHSPSMMYNDYVNYLFISSLFNQSNRTDDAIKAAKIAYDKASGNEQQQIAKLSLASAFQTAKNFSEAEKILNDLLVQTPGNPIALNNLGYLYLTTNKNLDKALVLIKNAVKIEPNNPSYLDSLGWAYFKLKKYNEAKINLEKAVKLSPNSSTILEHLGDVYEKLGKNTEAKTKWEKALTHTSNSEEINRIKVKINK